MRRLGLIVMLGALTAFGPISIDMYLPAFPIITQHFHATPAQVQLTLTACLAGVAAGLSRGPLGGCATVGLLAKRSYVLLFHACRCFDWVQPPSM